MPWNYQLALEAFAQGVALGALFMSPYLLTTTTNPTGDTPMTLQTDKRDEALLEDVASLFDMYAHNSEAFATVQKYVRYTLETVPA